MEKPRKHLWSLLFNKCLLGEDTVYEQVLWGLWGCRSLYSSGESSWQPAYNGQGPTSGQEKHIAMEMVHRMRFLLDGMLWQERWYLNWTFYKSAKLSVQSLCLGWGWSVSVLPTHCRAPLPGLSQGPPKHSDANSIMQPRSFLSIYLLVGLLKHSPQNWAPNFH